MDSEKQKALEAAGWEFGNAEDFLGLDEEERRIVADRAAANAGTEDICKNNHGGNPESVAAHAKARKSQDQIRIDAYLHKCGSYGATCDEIEYALAMSHQTASARCSELLAIQWIYRKPFGSGYEKRKTRTGRSAAVLVHWSFRNAI